MVMTRQKIKKEPKTIAFLMDLRPSTTYKAIIILLTKFGTNLYSYPIFKTTRSIRRSKKAKKNLAGEYLITPYGLKRIKVYE